MAAQAVREDHQRQLIRRVRRQRGAGVQVHALGPPHGVHKADEQLSGGAGACRPVLMRRVKVWGGMDV